MGRCALLIASNTPFLNSEELARRLGVSPRTVRLWAELDEIPAVRVGRQWRFRERDVESWIVKGFNPSLKTEYLQRSHERARARGPRRMS